MLRDGSEDGARKDFTIDGDAILVGRDVADPLAELQLGAVAAQPVGCRFRQ